VSRLDINCRASDRISRTRSPRVRNRRYYKGDMFRRIRYLCCDSCFVFHAPPTHSTKHNSPNTSSAIRRPHVKLIPIRPTEKLPIACVRSGPTLDKTTAGKAVKMMLDKNGSSNVRVAGSGISVRV
jgi:hypothetical protein